MKDNLKEYINQNRSSFDALEPPDLWTGIQAGMSTHPGGFDFKPFKNMINYGFGASAIVIVSLVAIQNLKTEKISKPEKLAISQPVRTVLDSSPALVKILPAAGPEKLFSSSKNEAPFIQPTEAPVIASTADIFSAPLPVTPPDALPAQEHLPVFTPQTTGSFSSDPRISVDTSFRGVKKLIVKGMFCNVTVLANNGEEVKLKGEMKESGGDMLMLGTKCYKKSDYFIKYRKDGDELIVWLEEEKLDKRVSVEIDDKNRSFLDLIVPSGVEVTVNNNSGNIKARGLRSKELSLHTSYGNISADDITGNVDLSSSSGNIRCSKVEGNIKGKSSYGHQRYDTISGNLLLKSSSGHINITSLTGNADVNSSYGHQKYFNIKGNLTAIAASGNVIIRGLKGNLSTSTSYGAQDYEDIEGDILGKASSGNIKINGSKGKLSLGTSYGNISGKNVRLLNSSSFTASSGSISMDLLNEFKELRFDLATSSGRLSVKKESEQASGDGKIVTGSGHIEIKGNTTYGNQEYR